MERKKQRKVLKWMLGQVYRAENRKSQLEKRLRKIEPECKTASASILFRLSDIEKQIAKQEKEIENAFVMVMDIIDYIPQNEIARQIFEMRHLDGLPFSDIAKAIPMSRTQCYMHYNGAIERLLDYRRIRKMVKSSEKEYAEWCENCYGVKKQSGVIKRENISGNNSEKIYSKN